MDEKERRRKANKDLIERMRRGDSLSGFNPQASFFPPRPQFKKNKKDMERVYGIATGEEKDDTKDSKPSWTLPDRT